MTLAQCPRFILYMAVTFAFLSHDVRAVKTLRIGVLVPLTGEKSMGQEVVAAAHLGVKAINEDRSLTSVIANQYEFRINVSDTGCDTGQVLQRVVELSTNLATTGYKVDAFIGPACDRVCETAGLLAGRWSVPMVSYGCEDNKLSDRLLYPTFFRTTSKFNAMTGFLIDVLTYFRWDHVTFVTADNRVWTETEEDIIREFPSRITFLEWTILSSDWTIIQPTLLKKSKESHVFLLLMFGNEVLRFLYEANTVGLLGGEQVFITIDFFNMGRRMGHVLDGSHLTGLLDITLDATPESQAFSSFLTQIETNFTHQNTDNGDDHCSNYEIAIHAGLLHDALLVYAKAVDATLADNMDPRDGRKLSGHIYDSIVQGVTGRVQMNADGSREGQFMLHNLQGGCYVPIARSAVACPSGTNVDQSNVVKCIVTKKSTERERGRAFLVLNDSVVWAGGGTVTPLGRPVCGWDGAYCYDGKIIKRVKDGGSVPFRPLIPDTVDVKARDIITECWRENPEERPSIDHVTSLIKHINGQCRGKKSLMEQMLDKVTREADLQAQNLEEEKNKSDQLLFQMLPPSVADCLKRQIEVKPETFQSATVYFSDIQGFTDLCSVSEPLEIVNFLNEVYFRFDSVIDRYDVYKVETIGDAYVVCSGVPIPVQNHAQEMAMCALHLVNISANLKVAHKPQHHFLMRIGLHCGPVAAGVVGRTMPRYCLFGDTVNTASRMESTGLPGHIQVSEQCKAKVEQDPDFILEAREPIFVKGKGTLQTYFLKGKVGFDPADSFLSLSSASVNSLRDKANNAQPTNIGAGVKSKHQQKRQQQNEASIQQLLQQQQQQSPRQLQTVLPMPQQQQQQQQQQKLQQQQQKSRKEKCQAESFPSQNIKVMRNEPKEKPSETILSTLSGEDSLGISMTHSLKKDDKESKSTKKSPSVTDILPNVCDDCCS